MFLLQHSAERCQFCCRSFHFTAWKNINGWWVNTMKRIFQMYQGLKRKVYILCFGRFVTAMGSPIWPMLTLILKSKLNFNAEQVALYFITAILPLSTASLCVYFVGSLFQHMEWSSYDALIAELTSNHDRKKPIHFNIWPIILALYLHRRWVAFCLTILIYCFENAQNLVYLHYNLLCFFYYLCAVQLLVTYTDG